MVCLCALPASATVCLMVQLMGQARKEIKPKIMIEVLTCHPLVFFHRFICPVKCGVSALALFLGRYPQTHSCMVTDVVILLLS